jgi:hypothetical protein
VACGSNRCYKVFEKSPRRPSLRTRTAGVESQRERIISMLDVIFVACTVVFFVVAVAYVWACDRLK